MGTSDSSRSPQCPVCNDALAFHTYETRKQAGIKTQCFVPACTEIYSLHWSFHLPMKALPLSESLCHRLELSSERVVELLMGTGEDVSLLFFFTSSRSTVAQRWRAPGDSCSVSQIYPFRKMMWASIHLYVSWG